MRPDLIKKRINIGIASISVTILGSLFTLALIKTGTLHFDAAVFSSFLIDGFPMMVVLFNLLFVITGLMLYNFLNTRFPNNNLERFSLAFSNLMLGFCLAFGFFGYTRLFTILLFAILFLLLFYIEYVNKTRFMYRFYRMYAALLIPAWFVNYTFVNTRGIELSKSRTISVSIAGVPVELYFYIMLILLAGVFIFEKLKPKEEG